MAEPEIMISVAEARKLTLSAIRALEPEEVSLFASLGRVLARPIISDENIPSFDNSAMDGYAVRRADVKSGTTVLRVEGEIPCGVPPPRGLQAGECMRIMTGAQIPDGADAVIQQELVTVANGAIQFSTQLDAGAIIRRAGTNVQKGQEVIPQGTTVTPGGVSMLASLGYSSVWVVRKPRVAVYSSGDELVPVSDRPGPSEIRNSNGPTLGAQVIAGGGMVARSGVLRDNVESIRREIVAALSDWAPDAIVISGGASVGDYDLVRQELEALGMTVPFWKVRQRPGKPLAFGILDRKPVFMLPGNPVSASICFEQYVRPCLAKMLGRNEQSPQLLAARFQGSIAKRRDLYYFSRGVASVDSKGSVNVRLAGAQGSHVSQSLVEANCLIHLPELTDAPLDGDVVDIEWLKW